METAARRAWLLRGGAGVGALVVVVVVVGAWAAFHRGDNVRTTRQTAEPAAEASSTSSSTTTSTSTTSTTTRPVVTTAPKTGVVVTTTRPAPVLVEGVPQVTASPARGRVGTNVHIEGEGFTGQQWQGPGHTLYLAGPAGCDLYAEVFRHTVAVSAGGHLAGDFVVPGQGVCRQSIVGDLPVVAGPYRIVLDCTACTVGHFEVTGADPKPSLVRCADVAFAPNSDNAATFVVASGIPCPDAEAFVRKVGGPLGPVSGAARADQDGWVCLRTAQDQQGLPSAGYECTSGARRITFVRT